MWVKSAFFIVLIFVYRSQGAVLLWSSSKIEISPLNDFNNDILEDLIQELGQPQVTVYKSDSALLPHFKEFLTGYYTAYNPNGEVSTENAIEVAGIEDLKNLAQRNSNDNTLSVLVIPKERIKRQASSPSTNKETTTTTTSTSTSSTTSTKMTDPFGSSKAESSSGSPPDEMKAVFYRGQHVGKDAMKLYGLLYSSGSLRLETKNTTVYLGTTKADMIQVDTTKENVTRLNVKINVEDHQNIVTLRFIFSWSVTKYWTLKSLKIQDTNNNFMFDMKPEKVTISAPINFSYHCSGEIVFVDGENRLVVNDLQVQIDAASGKFSDAYDCVGFTTAPILAGLFVTSILGVVLIIALVAISEIKTMDKFDNYKTKQLVVTVSE